MAYEAKILADSVSPDGVRLTTFQVTFPRIVLSEFNTHRMFSRNSASSRAIPVRKMIDRIMSDPYIPSSWGKNQKGMQAGQEADEITQGDAEDRWYRARDAAIECASGLLDLGIHKQLTNRLLEPFMWHTVIVTATEWSNFFHLRCHPDAHPDIRIPAELMREEYETNLADELSYGQWHTPFWPMSGDVRDPATGHLRRPGPSIEDQMKISVGRCARVSYLTHEGVRDPSKDIELHDRLLTSGHLSPFEHVARPMTQAERQHYARRDEHMNVHPEDAFCGNFRGWVQYRKLIPGEHDILGAAS